MRSRLFASVCCPAVALLAIASLCLSPLCGCAPQNEARIERPAAAPDQPGTAALAAGAIDLQYVLPEQEVTATSTAARWSLAAPVRGELADPNLIVYDQAYVEAYVNWAVNTPTECGPATYVIVTPQGERSVVSGLDGSYLGQRFRAEDLLGFLKTRTAGKRIERTFRIDNAEAVKVLRDDPESLAAKRLGESPWDRDTRTVIDLLGLVQYEPAHATLAELAKDTNRDVRYSAIIALGRLAVPAAIEVLEKLLDDEATRSTAADALAMSGEAALPAITRALDHPDKTARNHVVFSLGRHADPVVAVPALRKVMVHSDPEMREWGVAVLVDLTSRGGPEEGKPYVAELTALLKEDPNENTRRGAALALLNMKEVAAPAEEALRYAAENEQNSQARDFAQRALRELKAARERQP
jgi:HEAT repeat protein